MVFDLKRLGLAEQLAAVGGVLLFIFLFVFHWYGVHGTSFGVNAWDAHTILRWLFLLTAVLAVGAALLKATDKKVALPVSANLVLAGVAGFATICLLWRMLVDNPGPDQLVDVKFGAWLGLLCLLAIDAGAFLGLQEEGFSLSSPSSAPTPAPAAATATAAAAPAPASAPAPEPPPAPEQPPEAPGETSPTA